LLTEAKPYQLKRQSAAALEEAIASVDVRLASTASANKIVSKDLSGDVDAILNKALKKSVVERYPSVDAFAQDIERHLANLPVQARPDKRGYRLQKFIDRNKLPVSAAAAVTVTLIAGVAGVLWQVKVAAQERDRALENADRTELANSFLIKFIENAGSIDSPVIMRDLLAQSEKQVTGISKDPVQQATLFVSLAGIYGVLGQGPKERELLERAKQSVSQSSDKVLASRIACESAYASSKVVGSTGAKQEMVQALESLTDDITGAAGCLNSLAYFSQNDNDGPSAVMYSERALSTFQNLRRPETQVQLERSIRAGLATSHLMNGSYAQSDLEFKRLMKQYDATGDGDSVGAVAGRNNWAGLRFISGDAQEAVKLYDQLIKDSSARSPTGHAPYYAYGNLGRSLFAIGDYDASLNGQMVALEVAVESKNDIGIALAKIGLADILLVRGAADEGEKSLAQARQLLGEKLGKKNVAVVRLTIVEADLAMLRGNYEHARAWLTDLIDILNDGRKPSAIVSVALRKRSQASLASNQTSEAAKDADLSLKIAQSVRGTNPHSFLIGNSLLAHACISAKTGDADRAYALAKEAMSHFMHAVVETHVGRRVASELVEKKISVCPTFW
jgi:eukaryotic-like serine/threonine-protein kinase